MANNRDRITKLQGQISELEERIEKLQQLTETTDGRFQVIQDRKNEAINIKNEIDKIKQEIEEALTNIQDKKNNALELEGSIKELVEDAETSKETFEEHSQNLQEIENKIEKFEKEITEQLNRAASGALALAFSNRQEEIENELIRWRGILFKATGALILVALSFLIYSFFTTIGVQFFLKLSVSIPFIFIVWFASRQYTKERYILERYAFKAAQAKSLAAFSKTVKETDNTETGQKEAQKFVISSINRIYIAPKLNDKDESGLILDKILKAINVKLK